MLISHLNAIEKVLLAKSDVASNAGHPNLRGGPREWFIEEFLANHLPSLWEIGQGEIISSMSVPRPPSGSYRNQNDLIVYRRDFPKISYSPRDTAYMIEGVVATLEIKSKVDLGEFRKACVASLETKTQISEVETRLGLRVDNQAWVISHIISYVVAYDGPASILTAAKWLSKLSRELQTEPRFLIDMMVILGKGVVWRRNAFPACKTPNGNEGDVWAYIEQPDKNLYALFTHMLTIGNISSPRPNITGYVSQLPVNEIKTI